MSDPKMTETILNEQTGHPLQTKTHVSLWNKMCFGGIIIIILFCCFMSLFSNYSEPIQIKPASERHLQLFDQMKSKIMGSTTDWKAVLWEKNNMRPLADNKELQKELNAEINEIDKKNTFLPEKFQAKLKKIASLISIPDPYRSFIVGTVFKVLTKAAVVILKIVTGNWDLGYFVSIVSTLHEIIKPEGDLYLTPPLPKSNLPKMEQWMQKARKAIHDKIFGIYEAWKAGEDLLFADRVLEMSIYVFTAIAFSVPFAAPVTSAFVITISGVRLAIKLTGRIVADPRYHTIEQVISNIGDKQFINEFVPEAAYEDETLIAIGQFKSQGQDINVEFFGHWLDIAWINMQPVGWTHFFICGRTSTISLTDKGIRVVQKISKSEEHRIFIEIDITQRIRWVATLELYNRLDCPAQEPKRAEDHWKIKPSGRE